MNVALRLKSTEPTQAADFLCVGDTVFFPPFYGIFSTPQSINTLPIRIMDDLTLISVDSSSSTTTILDTNYREVRVCLSYVFPWEVLTQFKKKSALDLKPADMILSTAAKTVNIQQGQGANERSKTACLWGLHNLQCIPWMLRWNGLHSSNFVFTQAKLNLQEMGLPQSQGCHSNFPLIRWNMNFQPTHPSHHWPLPLRHRSEVGKDVSGHHIQTSLSEFQMEIF